MSKPTIDSGRLKAIASKYDIDEPAVVWKAYKGDIEEIKEADRVIVSKITSLAVDRDNEVVLPEGAVLDDYNGTVLWCHDYAPGDVPHARNLWVIPDSKKTPTYLKAATEYTPPDINEFGERMFKYLAKWKGPMGKSIGFIPLESYTPDDGEAWEKVLDNWKGRYSKTKAASSKEIIDPERIFSKWALLEYSDVPVPANQEAIQEAKMKGLLTDEQIAEYVSEPVNIEEKPFSTEHACRLRDPGAFQEESFRRTTREHEGKQYSIIMGKLKGETTMTEQAYRYKKAIWSASQARAHCASHDGTFEAAATESSIDDTTTKEGRVLSEKNRSLVKQCADMLMELHQATEPKRDDLADLLPDKELANADEEIDPHEIAGLLKDTITEIFKPSGDEKGDEKPDLDDFNLDELPTPEEMRQLKEGKVL